MYKPCYHRRAGWLGVAIFICLAAFFAFTAVSYVDRYSLSVCIAASIYICFLSLVILAITPASPAVTFLQRIFSARKNLWLLFAFWIVPYLIYSFGGHQFKWTALVRLLLICAPPVLLYAFVPVHTLEYFCWQDLFAAGWWILTVLSRFTANIWTIPVNLDFLARLFLLAVASWTWVFIRRVPALGYRFHFSLHTARVVAINFCCFAAIAIPAGAALHFTRWNPRWRGWLAFCGDYVEIFLFIALLEELFFRGFLQTLLSKSLKSPVRGQLLVSVLFGLFHIFHAPVPNWRYVILATVAGWFYGSSFRSDGTIMASALTHALVDTTWRTWFHI